MNVTGIDNNPNADTAEAPGPRPAASGRNPEEAAVLILLVILALAAWFRFTGLNWDGGTHLHPDERFLTDLAGNLSGVDNPLDYLRTSVSTLNPYNFGRSFYVYGNFPMTATRYAAEGAANLCDTLSARAAERPELCARGYTGYDGIHLVGRFLSALVDLVSVLFTFLIGRRLYGRWAGLFAALLLALAVMPIQQSHFFTMDNWATVFTTLGLYAAVRAATIGDPEPRWRLRWYALFGLALGLAAASRINMAPLALVINVSAIIWLVRRRLVSSDQWSVDSEQLSGTPNSSLVGEPKTVPLRHSSLSNQDLQRALLGIALAAVVSILTFRLAQPYAFSDAGMVREAAVAATGEEPGAFVVALKSIIGLNPQFLSNMAEIQRLQAPEASFPPALQWVDRPAILFPLSNMILYGMGLTAGLFAWFAVLWALWRMFSGVRDWRLEIGDSRESPISNLQSPEWMLHAIPVFWTLTYFLYMGTRWVKSVRYFLPLYPALFIVAGWAIVFLWQRARRAHPVRRDAARAAVALLAAAIILPSLLWAIMFTRIYREPMTRVAASEWIYENVPSGATLLYDTADGLTKELQLPLKGMLFESGGVPLFLDFTLPEDGILRAVRFNYLSDPDFDDGGVAPDDVESIRIRVNEGEPVEHPLSLDGERRAVIVELPSTPATAGTPLRITAEAGTGGPFRAGTSLLVNEHWDDLLPVGLDGRNAYGSYYTEVTGGQRPVTHPDSPEKREEVIAWLDEADYIMISSQRALWHLARLPLTYPMMMKYYEGLFSGELGFDLVAQFNGNTSLGPLHVSDTTAQISLGEPPEVGWPPPSELGAEEAFSVYDHPPVWIFRKSDRYTSENTRSVLESVDLSNVVVQNPLEATRARNGLMLTEAEREIQQSGGSFDEAFDVDGALSRQPWLAAVVWATALVLLGWAAFPIAYTALRGLPDRGYALSRVLALLLISYLPWLAASLKWLPFTRGTVVLALLAVLVLSIALFVRRRAEMIAFVRERASYILLVETLGLALFALMIVIRLGNPDVWDVIWGGEKPMDLSYFTAVMRSTTFPPYDPWNAGGYINYYYYGFVFAGAITKLLGVVPAVAYNLVLPMLFSMTGLGVFSLAWNLVTAVDRRGETTGAETTDKQLDLIAPVVPPVRRLSAEIRSRAAVAGFIAVALALLLGNLAQVSVIGNAWYQSGAEALGEIPLVGRAARALDGGIKVMGGQPAPIYPGDWFWTASRAIPAAEGEVQPITEFPFFTFLYADLHAHMLSMPLTMLALGWAVGLALLAGDKNAGEQGSRGEGEKGRKVAGEIISAPLHPRSPAPLLWFVGALAIGVLRPTNTWDWPTYLLLGSLAAAYYVIRREGGITLRSMGKAAIVAAALFGLSTLLFLPFSANYGSAYSSVSLWPGSYTLPWNYLLVHGLFLFFVITHLVREFRDWTASWTEAGKRRLEPMGWIILLAAGLFVAVTTFLLVRGYWVAPLALPLLTVAGLLALRPGLPTARRIVLALMSAALGLTLLVEIVVLDGDVGRMNTVFKFYLQVWLMLSVACGPAAVWAWVGIRRTKRLRVVWQAALGILVAAALLYPLTATAAKWGIRMNKDAPHTLDGAAFLEYVEYGDTDYMGNSITIRPGDDAGAIDWLQRNVEGSPVVMEAHGGNPYRSTVSRIAMYTGLPSVVGWDWHQRQQRAVTPGTLITSRIEDVNNFYNTPDAATARNILEEYGVEYIVVGSLENAYYWPQGLGKFDQMVAEGILAEVYRDETARIFRVTG